MKARSNERASSHPWVQERGGPGTETPVGAAARGDRLADRATAIIGSWRFIIVLFVLLVLWIVLNIVAWMDHWDPYPFIFLNLVLSFQGAFAAPVILMSQNRQEERDRQDERRDHAINLRAEREIVTVLDRMDELARAHRAEIAALRAEQQALTRKIEALLSDVQRTRDDSV